jgi:hypothetical protein
LDRSPRALRRNRGRGGNVYLAMTAFILLAVLVFLPLAIGFAVWCHDANTRALLWSHPLVPRAILQYPPQPPAQAPYRSNDNVQKLAIAVATPPPQPSKAFAFFCMLTGVIWVPSLLPVLAGVLTGDRFAILFGCPGLVLAAMHAGYSRSVQRNYWRAMRHGAWLWKWSMTHNVLLVLYATIEACGLLNPDRNSWGFHSLLAEPGVLWVVYGSAAYSLVLAARMRTVTAELKGYDLASTSADLRLPSEYDQQERVMLPREGELANFES